MKHLQCSPSRWYDEVNRCTGVRSYRALGHGEELRCYSSAKGKCWIIGLKFLKITLAILGECITTEESGSREASAPAQETMAAWMSVEAMEMENYKHLGLILKAELAGLADE